MRRVIEEAWFARCPVRVRYRRSDGSPGERTVTVERVLMERTMTMLECEDVATRERRTLRLDRIDAALRIAQR